MNTGDIVLVPFPFSGLEDIKLRPAIVVCRTKDYYQDVILCAISSVVPDSLSENEMLVNISQTNRLRANSIIKVDRIMTAKKESVRANLGKLNRRELKLFTEKFKSLI